MPSKTEWSILFIMVLLTKIAYIYRVHLHRDLHKDRVHFPKLQIIHIEC